jgi:quercetin dioxygenase-like cupin family protein
MKSRREFLRAGFAGLVVIAAREPGTVAQFGLRTLSNDDMPSVSLNGWQATFLELTFPPGLTAPGHTHPGFVHGYVLEGELSFHLEGEPETVLSAGETFFEAPGAIHLPSGSASPTKPARVLVIAFGEKGKALTKPL